LALLQTKTSLIDKKKSIFFLNLESFFGRHEEIVKQSNLKKILIQMNKSRKKKFKLFFD